METINSVATAASRAIWGEPKTEEKIMPTTVGHEPIAGELGNTKAGEPYDKGNEEPTTSEPKSLTKTSSNASEPKSLTKTSSRELTSSDSTTDLPSTSNLSSTAAHSSPLANHETSSAAYVIGTPLASTHSTHSTHEKKPETATETALPRDEKTDAATKAAIDQLEKQTKTLSVGDTKNRAADAKGDGLVSAKKVEQGEGVNTGVKSTSREGAQASKEPASIVEPAKKTVSPAAASSSTTSKTPATSSPVAPTKSQSSGSSEEDVETGGRKKKLSSLKEKIKAKLHKH